MKKYLSPAPAFVQVGEELGAAWWRQEDTRPRHLRHPTPHCKRRWVAPQHAAGKNKVTCFQEKFCLLLKHLNTLRSCGLCPPNTPDHRTLLSLFQAFCRYGTFDKEQFLCQQPTLVSKNTGISLDSNITPVVPRRLKDLFYLTLLKICRRNPLVHLAAGCTADAVSEKLLSWSPLASPRWLWNTREKRDLGSWNVDRAQPPPHSLLAPATRNFLGCPYRKFMKSAVNSTEQRSAKIQESLH